MSDPVIEVEIPEELVRLLIEDGRKKALDTLGEVYSPTRIFTEEELSLLKSKYDEQGISLPSFNSDMSFLNEEELFLLSMNIYENASLL